MSWFKKKQPKELKDIKLVHIKRRKLDPIVLVFSKEQDATKTEVHDFVMKRIRESKDEWVSFPEWAVSTRKNQIVDVVVYEDKE